MSWEKDDCELSALKKSLESQAVGMASLAARLRTVECNVEQQLYANKGLKSALVKLASREAATRSQVYATLERMEADISEIRTGRRSTNNIESEDIHEQQSLNSWPLDCENCKALSKRLELVERRLEAIMQIWESQPTLSKEDPTSKLSMRDNLKNYVDKEHICSVTTEHALEPFPTKSTNSCKDGIKTENRESGEEENDSSPKYILKKLEAISRQENISPDELYSRLNFCLKRMYLSTVCGRNLSAKLIFDLGHCFYLVESNRVYKKLEFSKRKQLTLLLKELLFHFDASFSRKMKSPEKKPAKQDYGPLSTNDSVHSEHCSTSTFEAICAEKQGDYPLQQIFDDSSFAYLDEKWNNRLSIDDGFHPNDQVTKPEKETRNRKLYSCPEGKENMKFIALDDSTDLEWKECFRSMNEDLF